MALLHHQRESDLPLPICYFAKVLELCSQVCNTEEGVCNYLNAEAHKGHHVDTVVYYVQALKDFHNIWKITLIDANFASQASSSPELRFPLSPQQNALLQKYEDLLARRSREVMVSKEMDRFRYDHEQQPPKTTIGEDINYFWANWARARVRS